MAKPLKVKKLGCDDPPYIAAKRILRIRLKEYYSHWPDPDQTPTPTQLHNLRISGKRLRYSAESLRYLYRDRLALLIELLKRGQDMLGEIQDCRTHREDLAKDLSRLKRRKPRSEEIAALENLIAEYDQRQKTLFGQFQEIWRGLTMKEFRDGLKALISRTGKPESEKIDKSIDKAEAPDPVFHYALGAANPAVNHD